MDFVDKRNNMVKNQLLGRGISNLLVLEAFLDVPRENFVPKYLKNDAYLDAPLPIGQEQTISQPFVVALMTDLIQPNKEDKVLEIGCGSGYQAAILSKLVKEVISVEIVKKLADFSRDNLEKLKFLNVSVINEDGAVYFKENEYFDKIIITAAVKEISNNWIKQLKQGGLLVLPQGDLSVQMLKVYKKISDRLVLTKESILVVFVPLTGKEGLYKNYKKN